MRIVQNFTLINSKNWDFKYAKRVNRYAAHMKIALKKIEVLNFEMNGYTIYYKNYRKQYCGYWTHPLSLYTDLN